MERKVQRACALHAAPHQRYSVAGPHTLVLAAVSARGSRYQVAQRLSCAGLLAIIGRRSASGALGGARAPQRLYLPDPRLERLLAVFDRGQVKGYGRGDAHVLTIAEGEYPAECGIVLRQLRSASTS